MQEYIFELKTNGYTFPAAAIYNKSAGFYCGYLGIDETNGFYGSNNIDEMARMPGGFHVHGGITFSGAFKELEIAYQNRFRVDFSNCEAESSDNFLIKKIKINFGNLKYKTSEKDRQWVSSLDWLGFDCGHPIDRSILNPSGKERDVDFVLKNIKSIAKVVAGSSYEIYKRSELNKIRRSLAADMLEIDRLQQEERTRVSHESQHPAMPAIVQQKSARAATWAGDAGVHDHPSRDEPDSSLIHKHPSCNEEPFETLDEFLGISESVSCENKYLGDGHDNPLGRDVLDLQSAAMKHAVIEGKVCLSHRPITEEEHNKMMALAVTGDLWAEKYVRDLKVSN